MSIDYLKRLLWLIVLAFVQVLVLNRIHLLGVATPMLSVYFVILFRQNEPKWVLLLWAFVLGLIIDTFSNTPGAASASLTLVAALQPYLLLPFIQREDDENVKPGIHSLGLLSFFYYSLLLVSLFCLVYFTLEMFTFFNWLYWLECIGGSIVLTMLLIMVIDTVRRTK